MTRDKLRNIFQSPFNYENWQSVLVSLFSGVGKNCQLSLESTPQQMPVADDEKMDGFYIGEIRIGMESVKLYTFHIKDDRTNISRNRVGLRNTANYLRDVSDAAIVVYYNDHQWRVSYICDILRSLKRFSFVFGDQQALYTTPIKRFENLSAGDISLDAILEAFSVEALSKDFFKSYKAQYDKFCSHIGSNSKSNRDYVKKMLGRLVFLQFLQKKGWMNGDYNYMQNLFAQSPYQDDFLEEVLEPLFFHVLNTKEQERNHPKLKNLGDEINIPYLNGGLFEADCNDKKRVVFDAKLFSELFDFFSHYNFTIDENDPNDAEVGIDPEMLGHIFENLLEDNKDKGAFYTPKEIVQYMCRQSLIEYLQSKLGKHTEIESFVNNHDTGDRLDNKNYIAANAKTIEELLDNVKICDPAIGSGAFPMGILNEIFHAKMALDMTLDRAAVKKKIIQNSIYGVDIEQGAVDISRLRFWLSLVVDDNEPQPLPNLDYKIMQGNSLLESFEGEDLSKLYIETEATDLFSTTKHRKDIIDLQNRYFAVTDHTEKNEIKAEINDIIIKHLSNSINNKQKKLEEQIATTQKTISSFELEIDKPTTVKGKKVEFQKRVESDKRNLTQNEAILSELKDKALKLANTNETNRPYFLWHLFFKDVFDKGGFDIVIGNPPYGVSIKGKYRKDVENHIGKVPDYEIYYYFIEIARKLLSSTGVLSYIIPNTYLFNTFAAKYRLKLLSEWNMIEVLDCTSFPIFEKATVLNTINTWQIGSSQTVGYRNTSNISNFEELIKRDRLTINVDSLTELNKNWGLAFRLSENVINLIAKIKKLSNPIESYFPESSQGLIAYDKYRGQSAEIISNRAYHYSNLEKDGLKKWLWGGDITRYSVKWNQQEYIDYCEDIANPRQPKFFLRERVLIREITNPSIFAALTDEELYNDPSVLIVLASENYSAKVLVAILNSKLATFYHFNNAPKATKGAFPKILVKDIKEFPLPRISKEGEVIINGLVDKILDAKQAAPTVDTTALEAQIDSMVYALYNLTPEEIAIIENKIL